MILACPNCGTQYVVKDGAIPPDGRQVRCAACKHSWHQDPDEAPTATASPPSAAAAAAMGETGPETDVAAAPDDRLAEDESLAAATLIEPRAGPESEERAYEEAVIESGGGGAAASADPEPTAANVADWREPPEAEAAPDTFSPFAEDDDLEPRRRSAVAVLATIVGLVVALAALFWFFAPPDLKARVGLVAAESSPLALVTTHMDRQRLESGNELLTVTGRVINPTAEEQDVPPLQAQLRSRTGKIVYSWTIAPPARSLAAGASASFNSAEVNVPPGGDELTITLGEPKG